MPYDRPTITELNNQQVVDLSSQLNITQDQVTRSNVGVLAKVQAGGLHGLHGHLTWLLQQCFEDTADNEYLYRHGESRGIVQKLASIASGSCVVKGEEGASVVVSEILQRADGQQFHVTTGATISNGEASIDVEAMEAGVIGNTSATVTLSFITLLPGIETIAISGVLAGGTDIESIASYRDRVLTEIREPPHGGNEIDYKQWVRSTPNVNVHRVWVIPKWMGKGTVSVFFTVNNGEIPDAATIALVKDVIDEMAPITADVFIIAPTPVSVSITVSHLQPDTPAVRKAAEEELKDLLMRSANVEDGDGSGTLLLSHLREAISIASGERDHVIVLPVADTTFTVGELPVFGGVIWT